MLTSQHQIAQSCINPIERNRYNFHMCSVCHALGDEYGFAARAITNHDIILFNTLYNAQCEHETEVIVRHCPLNLTRKVSTTKNIGSKISAAIGIELARTSAWDKVEDSRHADIAGYFAYRFLTRHQQKARQVLTIVDSWNVQNVTTLSRTQALAEKSCDDPAIPSAQAGAALFGLTSVLAQAPCNRELLEKIGALYGRYIYLNDAVVDFLKDYHLNEFNPLKKFSRLVGKDLFFERAGIEWLHVNFVEILNGIQLSLSQVHFCRDASLLTYLLCSPIAQLVTEIESELSDLKDHIIFRPIQATDVLQLAFFATPFSQMPVQPSGSRFDVSNRFFSRENNLYLKRLLGIIAFLGVGGIGLGASCVELDGCCGGAGGGSDCTGCNC